MPLIASLQILTSKFRHKRSRPKVTKMSRCNHTCIQLN